MISLMGPLWPRPARPPRVWKDTLRYIPAMTLHRVVALLTPPQSPFELACASEVFSTVPQDAPPRYSFQVCAERPGPLPTTAGYSMLVEAGLTALQEADTVVIP